MSVGWTNSSMKKIVKLLINLLNVVWTVNRIPLISKKPDRIVLDMGTNNATYCTP